MIAAAHRKTGNVAFEERTDCFAIKTMGVGFKLRIKCAQLVARIFLEYRLPTFASEVERSRTAEGSMQLDRWCQEKRLETAFARDTREHKRFCDHTSMLEIVQIERCNAKGPGHEGVFWHAASCGLWQLETGIHLKRDALKLEFRISFWQSFGSAAILCILIMEKAPSPGSPKLDLILINPSNRVQIYQKLGDELVAVEPPIWAGFIADYVRRQGYSVKILDAEALELNAVAAAKAVAEEKPLLAGVIVFGHQPSASTQNMAGASSVCTELKKIAPQIPIVIAGGHVSALPERTLHEEKVDYVCEGEGIYTIHKLLEALKKEKNSQLEGVPGLWYRKNGEIHSTAKATVMADLDKEIPTTAWDLLPMHLYRAHNWHCFDDIQHRQPYAAIYTSLGCPFKCTFCCINAPFGKPSIRYRSPDTMIAEIAVLVEKYGVKNIKIADEMFVLNIPHVEGICDRIIERGYDLNIWAYARVDTVKEGILPKMKKAGFNWLALGIESGSKFVRDGANKRFTGDDIRNVVRSIQSAGIRVIGNYIFGLPDDNVQTMQETLDMAIDLNCEFANFYSAMAYPGSPLYTMAVKEALPLPRTWSGFSQHAKDALPLPTKHIPAAEVLKFRDRAFQIYFTNARYLDYVDQTFGSDTVDHLRKMTKHRLERDLVTS